MAQMYAKKYLKDIYCPMWKGGKMKINNKTFYELAFKYNQTLRVSISNDVQRKTLHVMTFNKRFIFPTL